MAKMTMQMTVMRASFFTVPRRPWQTRSEEGLKKDGVAKKISRGARKISHQSDEADEETTRWQTCKTAERAAKADRPTVQEANDRKHLNPSPVGKQIARRPREEN